MPGGCLWILEATFVTFGCELQITLLREASIQKNAYGGIIKPAS